MVLRTRVAVEVRSDVLGEGGIAFEGEGRGVEGKRNVFGDATGDVGDRFGGLELWNDVSSSS